jgi:hypothetical protein
MNKTTKMYTCLGLGGEYHGTIQDYENYFESHNIRIKGIISKKENYQKIVTIYVLTENNVQFDVTLFEIKPISEKGDLCQLNVH